MKTIQVDEEVWKKISVDRINLGLKTLNEVIKSYIKIVDKIDDE